MRIVSPGSSSGGWTLLESLICCAIVAILGFQATPNLGEMVNKGRISQTAEVLRRQISLARFEAINRSAFVTFCRSSDGLECGGNWEKGSIVFTDYNGDRIINGNDELLSWKNPSVEATTIRYRAFGNRQYLQMTPEGFTRYQNGNFTICPNNSDTRLARQLIISVSGRVRDARDSDGDGVPEDSQGDPVECP